MKKCFFFLCLLFISALSEANPNFHEVVDIFCKGADQEVFKQFTRISTRDPRTYAFLKYFHDHPAEAVSSSSMTKDEASVKRAASLGMKFATENSFGDQILEWSLRFRELLSAAESASSSRVSEGESSKIEETKEEKGRSGASPRAKGSKAKRKGKKGSAKKTAGSPLMKVVPHPKVLEDKARSLLRSLRSIDEAFSYFFQGKVYEFLGDLGGAYQSYYIGTLLGEYSLSIEARRIEEMVGLPTASLIVDTGLRALQSVYKTAQCLFGKGAYGQAVMNYASVETGVVAPSGFSCIPAAYAAEEQVLTSDCPRILSLRPSAFLKKLRWQVMITAPEVRLDLLTTYYESERGGHTDVPKRVDALLAPIAALSIPQDGAMISGVEGAGEFASFIWRNRLYNEFTSAGVASEGSPVSRLRPDISTEMLETWISDPYLLGYHLYFSGQVDRGKKILLDAVLSGDKQVQKKVAPFVFGVVYSRFDSEEKRQFLKSIQDLDDLNIIQAHFSRYVNFLLETPDVDGNVEELLALETRVRALEEQGCFVVHDDNWSCFYLALAKASVKDDQPRECLRALELFLKKGAYDVGTPFLDSLSERVMPFIASRMSVDIVRPAIEMADGMTPLLTPGVAGRQYFHLFSALEILDEEDALKEMVPYILKTGADLNDSSCIFSYLDFIYLTRDFENPGLYAYLEIGLSLNFPVAHLLDLIIKENTEGVEGINERSDRLLASIKAFMANESTSRSEEVLERLNSFQMFAYTQKARAFLRGYGVGGVPDLTAARENIELAKQVLERSNHISRFTDLLVQEGTLYLLNEQFEEAIEVCSQGFDHARALETKAFFSEGVVDAALQLGHFGVALSHLEFLLENGRPHYAILYSLYLLFGEKEKAQKILEMGHAAGDEKSDYLWANNKILELISKETGDASGPSIEELRQLSDLVESLDPEIGSEFFKGIVGFIENTRLFLRESLENLIREQEEAAQKTEEEGDVSAERGRGDIPKVPVDTEIETKTDTAAVDTSAAESTISADTSLDEETEYRNALEEGADIKAYTQERLGSAVGEFMELTAPGQRPKWRHVKSALSRILRLSGNAGISQGKGSAIRLGGLHMSVHEIHGSKDKSTDPGRLRSLRGVIEGVFGGV